MITETDMRNQVIETLSGEERDYDVAGIVDELILRHGVTDIDDVPDTEYWGIVSEHEK